MTEIWLQAVNLAHDIGGVIYKGITFDEVAVDVENGKKVHFWANICEKCLEKMPLLQEDSKLDEEAPLGGICSVEGCWNGGTEREGEHYGHEIYYIDFKPSKVQKIKIWHKGEEKYVEVDRHYFENELKRRHITWE